jgi:molecular chaperone GrpE
MEAVRSMLPVIDDFERALQTAPSDDSPADYAKGVRLIHQRMLDAMSKLGLECLASVGAPFDPNLHHAIQKEEREEMDDQTILEEFQRGYTFKGKLLRPAMVKVSVKP